MISTPVSIITGFLGSGKTTLLLNILPQLLRQNPNYKLALLKNEFGDLAVDSQLASSSSISGVQEILNGCICCNLVGSLSTALAELTGSITPDRIVIETSGSAFPATLAMEVNRLGRETGGKYVLDGVITVIDVENWKGYDDTSFTARLQARYTDLIVFNKWEDVSERRWEECLDRLGDMEVDIAWVKSQRGWVDVNVVFGLDKGLAGAWESVADGESQHHDEYIHKERENHQSEVEVLSVTLSIDLLDQPDCLKSESLPSNQNSKIDNSALLNFLQTAPKDEIYRIKAILISSSSLPSSESSSIPTTAIDPTKYILNWSFGRWTFTPFLSKDSSNLETSAEHQSSVAIGQGEVFLRMILVLARGMSKKWKKRLEDGNIVRFDENGATGGKKLKVECIT